MEDLDPRKLLADLFDKKLLAVLRLFIDNPDKEYYLREVAKYTRVPVATVYRHLGKLKALDIIHERRIKKLKLYRLNETKPAKFIESILEVRKTALEEFLDLVKGDPHIQEIILHGKKQKDRANILIIGSGVNAEAIRQAVGTIKDKYGFSVIHLVLEPEQFEQMASMGLYSGEKRSLYKV
ncbi:ArsR family transcriptional regulator [Candidatus Woesearchaeota archaeon]|nr:MAG: ArsR family transcriptional regulator [Candidatus Woesearchaeota archaeon]